MDKLSIAQRRILLMLAQGNMLKRHNKGQWQDVYYLDYHSPANCQWLLDEGLIELKRRYNRDEVFGISEQGKLAVAPMLLAA